ncbi:hypothetical protein D3C83_142290 [compost metagenome]
MNGHQANRTFGIQQRLAFADFLRGQIIQITPECPWRDAPALLGNRQEFFNIAPPPRAIGQPC